MMNTQKAAGLCPLTQLPVGVMATVVKLKLAIGEQSRLAQLGLRRGCNVRVVQDNGTQSVLLALGDCRIGVNYETAQRIFVY